MGKFDTRKVDKVETPPSYRVTPTVQTRDQKQQKGEERREEDEYSETGGVKGWQKYHTDAKDRRALKLRLKDIARIFFNQVTLQRGLVIIDINLQLINGQILKNAHLFSTKIDTYWKLKKLKSGEEIPLAQVITEQYLEVSVLHRGSAVRTEKGTKSQTKGLEAEKAEPTKGGLLWPPINSRTGKPNWIAIASYLIIAVIILIALIMIL